MDKMLLTTTLLYVSVFAAVAYIAFGYFRDKNGLRRFPSPPLAAITPLWFSYQASTGQRFKVIDDLHGKLGPVVRIAPNHVSFADPQAYKDIYGHGSPILKDQFYPHAADGNPSMAQTTSKTEHARKRRALAHVFSAKEITRMEPRVLEVTRKLCADLQIKSEGGRVSCADPYPSENGSFDVRPWMNMFSYDAITTMFWSSPYGFLDKGNDLCPAMIAPGRVKQVHAMDSFHSASRFNVMFCFLSDTWDYLAKRALYFTHDRQGGLNFGAMARHLVLKRLENPPDEPDLFSNLPTEQSGKNTIPMPVEELIAESITMLDAGNDTTQTSLTNCLYHLARYPEKQEKLHYVLAGAISPADPAKPAARYSSELQHIPYLRACLDESFRCRPPVASGLPRRTVGRGSTIAGHFIPADTTVSMPLYTLHRNEALFKEARTFIPERWLAESDAKRGGYVTESQEVRNLKDFVLPFSLGGRACIGRNLAYMELSMVIAALVLGFEWQLAEPGMEMDMVERFNCNPKELLVRARVREGVDWLG